MNFEYQTPRLLLRVEHQNCARRVLEFYQRNRPFFDAWELTRADNFYSESYQRACLQIEYNEIVRKHMARFYLYHKEDYQTNPDSAPIIGSVSISDIRLGGFRRGMFGYKLDHELWGQGYAREACEQLIQIAWNDLQLHRLESFIMPTNQRSIRLIEQLGFQYEGLDRAAIEVNHKYEDHLRYALINETDQ
jgi:ribosomal-protein-alanine N-acetyltransferase